MDFELKMTFFIYRHEGLDQCLNVSVLIVDSRRVQIHRLSTVRVGTRACLLAAGNLLQLYSTAHDDAHLFEFIRARRQKTDSGTFQPSFHIMLLWNTREKQSNGHLGIDLGFRN